MDSKSAHEKASDVSTEQGRIILDGPDGVAVTMTAEAAEETAHRLLHAVSKLRREGYDGHDGDGRLGDGAAA